MSIHLEDTPPADTPPHGLLDGVLDAVCDSLPNAVLSRKGTAELLQHAGHLPAYALDTTFGFESRLAEARASCDFFLWAVPGTRLARYFIERGARDNATRAEAGLGWYLTEVGRPESFLSRWLTLAILECDVVEPPTHGPATMGVFLEAHDRVEDAHPLVHRTRRLEKLGNPGVMTAAMSATVGREESTAERLAVEALFAALPTGAGCSHVGAFPLRECRALRVVFSMALGESAAFLARVGWRGDLDSLNCMSRDLEPLVHRIGLSCDLTSSGLSPRVGFELFRARGWLETPASEWHGLLDYLGERGLATPEKAQALKLWRKRQMLFDERGATELLSGVNHLKLILDGSAVQTKAYIAARLVPAAMKSAR